MNSLTLLLPTKSLQGTSQHSVTQLGLASASLVKLFTGLGQRSSAGVGRGGEAESL